MESCKTGVFLVNQKIEENTQQMKERRVATMANQNPNYGPMLKKSREKTQASIHKVESALKEMVKKHMKINFNSVSSESGVSKSFIYNIEALRKRIEYLRSQQEGAESPREVKRSMKDESKDVIIGALKKRNKELEDENKRLKNQLKIDFASVYEQI
jgi:CHAT domain-containing protein